MPLLPVSVCWLSVRARQVTGAMLLLWCWLRPALGCQPTERPGTAMATTSGPTPRASDGQATAKPWRARLRAAFLCPGFLSEPGAAECCCRPPCPNSTTARASDGQASDGDGDGHERGNSATGLRRLSLISFSWGRFRRTRCRRCPPSVCWRPARKPLRHRARRQPAQTTAAMRGNNDGTDNDGTGNDGTGINGTSINGTSQQTTGANDRWGKPLSTTPAATGWVTGANDRRRRPATATGAEHRQRQYRLRGPEATGADDRRIRPGDSDRRDARQQRRQRGYGDFLLVFFLGGGLENPLPPLPVSVYWLSGWGRKPPPFRFQAARQRQQRRRRGAECGVYRCRSKSLGRIAGARANRQTTGARRSPCPGPTKTLRRWQGATPGGDPERHATAKEWLPASLIASRDPCNLSSCPTQRRPLRRGS